MKLSREDQSAISALETAALAYAGRGFRVFPVHSVDGAGRCSCGRADCTSKGKHPRIRDWVTQATSDEHVVRDWWKRLPTANIGIATGAVSSVVVLDIDPRHGGDASLARLTAKHGALPSTVEATTGGGGRHLYFAHPESQVSNKVNLDTGIDLRGDGGFVVAPPSLHASGQRYEWKPGHSPEELSPALPPTWLLKPTQWVTVRWAVETVAPISEGARNDTLTSLAGTMRRRSMSPEAIKAALQEENSRRCDPPLPEEEVDRIASSVARYPPDTRLPVTSIPGGPPSKRGKSDPDSNEETPWHEPVNGAALLQEIGEFVGRYVALPSPEVIIVIGAWVLSTYMFNLFEQHPFLVISSPEKRCGKTRLLEVLERLVHKPLSTAGMSEAVLFRVAAKLAPTFLIDEAQHLRNRDERSAPIHDLLCAANRRGKKVLRMAGPNHDQLEQFEIYSPKAIASIGKLTDIIMDRSIEIPMRRHTQTEQVARFFSAKAESESQPIRKQIVRWTQDHMEEVRAVYVSGQPPSFLRDREAENWAPLFALVGVADPASLPNLEEAARILASEVNRDNPSLAVQLLTDIREIFDAKKTDFIPTKDLLEALATIDEGRWIEINISRGLTAQSMAKLLKPFGIGPRQTRVGETNPRGYHRQDFTDAWARYLPPQPVTPVTAQSGSALSPTSSPLHKDASNSSENAEKPHGDRTVTGVTDVDPSPGSSAPAGYASSDSHLKGMVTNQPGLPQTHVPAPAPPAPSAVPGHAASLRKARPGAVGRKRTTIRTGLEVLKKSVEVLTK